MGALLEFKVVVAGIIFLTLIMPRRYFASYLGWQAIPAVLISVDLWHPPHWSRQNAGHALGHYALAVAAAAILAAIVLKLAVFGLESWWRRRTGAAPAVDCEMEAPSTATRFQLACLGVLAGVVAFLWLRSVLYGISPSWLAHGIAVTAIASFWAIPCFVPRPPTAPFLAPAFIAFRWATVFLLAFAAVMPTLVASKAEQVALGASYCILVADRNSTHRPARTQLDLSGLTMRARSRPGMQQHALLIVESGDRFRAYNWSYRQRAFVDEALHEDPGRYRSSASCSPETDFVHRLPIFF